MKLLMFRNGDERRLGVVVDNAVDRVADLVALAEATGAPRPPADLLALIDEGPAGLDRLQDLLSRLCLLYTSPSPRD